MSCFSVAFAVHTLADNRGWQQRSRLQGELRGLTDNNLALQDSVEDLAQEVSSLGGRGAAQEHAVRDELGWVGGPGDLVIHFE
jgi:cell division protein FtsB